MVVMNSKLPVLYKIVSAKNYSQDTGYMHKEKRWIKNSFMTKPLSMGLRWHGQTCHRWPPRPWPSIPHQRTCQPWSSGRTRCWQPFPFPEQQSWLCSLSVIWVKITLFEIIYKWRAEIHGKKPCWSYNIWQVCRYLNTTSAQACSHHNLSLEPVFNITEMSPRRPFQLSTALAEDTDVHTCDYTVTDD